MKRAQLLNIIAAIVLAIPLIVLLSILIPKYRGEIIVEAKNTNARTCYDIDGDRIPEKIQFENINGNDQLYCEVWSTTSLVGIWQKKAQLINRSVVNADIDHDGFQELLFFTIENDSIFGNALSVRIINNQFVAKLRHRIFVTASAGPDYDMHPFKTMVCDLDNDKFPELITNLNQGATVRGVYAVDFRGNKSMKADLHFIHVTDFYIDSTDAKKRIVVASYANGNIPQDKVKLAAERYGADTSKAHQYITDMQSHILVLNEKLQLLYGPVGYDGMFSMQRPLPIQSKNKILVLQTGIEKSDSIEVIRLFNRNLKLYRENKVRLPYNKDQMDKYSARIFFRVELNGKEEYIFVGNNDSIYRVNTDSLTVEFLAYFPEVKNGAGIKELDLDNDGSNEIVFMSDNGIYITRNDLSDGIHLPMEGKLDYRKDFTKTHPSEKTQGIRTICNRNHYIIQYSFNAYWYLKWILMPFSVLLTFSILVFLQRLQSRKLEERNRQLEKVVTERTHEISLQKELLEEKQKEILDSINYAKRIQEAILPSRYSLVENLKSGFVLYKPKDIVAGDFYWLEKHQAGIFLAAADCTGHGVPGAMVSVVCSNALSKALLEEEITITGKILDRTRELVIEKFSKSGENVKDGMDISLVRLFPERNKIQWSGANNPLWIVRNKTVQEFKPDKQPIGVFADPKPFTTQEIELHANDLIYLFTDGFEDQFGGEKGKKFKASKLKELLISIAEKEMDQQKEIINQTFEEWRGELEQVDDVCVIGIKI